MLHRIRSKISALNFVFISKFTRVILRNFQRSGLGEKA